MTNISTAMHTICVPGARNMVSDSRLTTLLWISTINPFLNGRSTADTRDITVNLPTLRRTIMVVTKGIFTWNADERRSNRYGGFFLGDSNYNESRFCPDAYCDPDNLEQFQEQKVKITATVVETADSGHMGDMFLFLPETPDQHIKPSRPDVGEVVVVGVGTLLVRYYEEGVGKKAFFLKPSDGRNKFWIDPRVLYRLHDQTVTISIEPTEEEEFPVTDLLDKTNTDVVRKVCDDDKGTAFQIKGKQPVNLHIKPLVERLGNGVFMMRNPLTNAPVGTDVSKNTGEVVK
jgi:hypothetical protein